MSVGDYGIYRDSYGHSRYVFPHVIKNKQKHWEACLTVRLYILLPPPPLKLEYGVLLYRSPICYNPKKEQPVFFKENF